MVLAIISASLAAVMFSVSMPGIFIGRGERHPQEEVSHQYTSLCSVLAQLSVLSKIVSLC